MIENIEENIVVTGVLGDAPFEPPFKLTVAAGAIFGVAIATKELRINRRNFLTQLAFGAAAVAAIDVATQFSGPIRRSLSVAPAIYHGSKFFFGAVYKSNQPTQGQIEALTRFLRLR